MKESRLYAAMQHCKQAVKFIVIFSCGINLLTLASPLYTLQIFDRVLSSGSLETLTMLSVIVMIIFLFLGALEAIRSTVLNHIGAWVDKQLSPAFLVASIRISAVQKTLSGSQALKDLSSIKGFITGLPLQQLCDAPWAIIFMIVLFFIHPIVGIIILVSSLILFGMALLNESQSKEIFEKASDIQTKNMKEAELMTRNAEVIESMGMTKPIVTKWEKTNLDAIQMQFEVSQKSNIISSVTKIIRLTIQMVTMAVSTYLVLDHKMTPGGIIAA
ncbi:MAG: type I secretion system permease/ATPase, partial [Candidatus Margulisbacteria bacterium]|nr:type I secretion system permease/ATPase [Candidatus Margulisiibacteriota bacterium]